MMTINHRQLHEAQDDMTDIAALCTSGARRRRFHRSGFALIMTIGLLAFLMVVMVGMSQAFVMQAKRTKFESADAQLRQMLIAGAGHAVSYRETALQGKGAAREKWEIELPLPQKLQARDAQLAMTSQPMPDGVQQVTIKATLGQSVATQQLTFTQGQPGLVGVSTIQHRVVIDKLQ